MTVGLRIGPCIGPRSLVVGQRGSASTTSFTVVLADSADPVISAANFNYTCVVTNTGGITANTVSCVITLDANVTYVSSAGTGWSFGVAGQVVTCTRATLAVGTAPTITITVTSPASTTSLSSSASCTATEVTTPVVDTEATASKLVSADATSGKRVPANATEWANLIAVAGLTGTVPVPDALWLCQEASGNLADSIGTFTLTASGVGLSYNVAAAGWTRKSVRTTNNSSGRWDNTDAGLPDLLTGDATMICYGQRQTVAASRMLMGIGTTQAYIGGPAAPHVTSGVNAADGADPGGAVQRPHGIVSDRTNSRARGFDDTQKLSPTFSTLVTGKRYTLGGLSGVVNPSGNDVMYAWAWFSAPSDANIKTILQTLGWTIAWS